MARKHLKRLAAPPSWAILRKEETFITRPNPGKHTLDQCLTICEILKRLKYVSTSREAKIALLHNTILIDGKRAHSPKTQAGLMDEITIGEMSYRILIDHRGHLVPVAITKDESGVKPCKVISKTMNRGGNLHIHTFDGRNLIADKPKAYTIGDTIMVTVPKQTVAGHYKLEPGAYVYLTGGKHLGDRGLVTSVKQDTIAYHTSQGQEFTTLKTYAFVLGKGKPGITLP